MYMDNYNIFNLSFNALMEKSHIKKIIFIKQIIKLAENNSLNFKPINVIKINKPGMGDKPNLVPFVTINNKSNSCIGLISTIHAICHIEFNAINLALDAIYRFQNMPNKYYIDWLKIAAEEAKHFNLIRNYLLEINYDYGDFDAHNNLWEMAVKTDYDILARMALVPRVLEARGLDVTPNIIKKFTKSKFNKMAVILQVIYEDEIGHVKIGNYWYKYLCDERNLDYIITFKKLINKHLANIKPQHSTSFNKVARLKAGFSKEELNIFFN